MLNIKKRRLISTLIIVSMLLSFAGCGASSKTSNNAAVPDAKKTYSFSFVGMSYAPLKDNPPVQKYLEDKYNVKFNMVYVDPNNYTDLMNLKFANNEIPDVFYAPDLNTYQQWVNQDLLAEVPMDLLNKNAPDIVKVTNDYQKDDKNIWQYAKVDGKYYGVGMIWADGVYTAPVVWRTDWLKNVGINKIPETIDEFETALYKFAKDDPDKDGKNDTYGLSQSGLNAIFGISGFCPQNNITGSTPQWALKDGKIVYSSIQPEMKPVLERIAKWYKDGVLDPEFITGENHGGYWAISQDFDNGKIGLSCLGSYYHWNEPYYEGGAPSKNYQTFKEIQGKNATYAFGVPAVGTDGQSGMKVPGTQGSFLVFGKQLEKEPEKMAKILQFFNGLATNYDDFLTAYYGIKGTHWDYNSHNEPAVKDEYSSMDARYGIGSVLTFLLWYNPEFITKTNKYQYEFADKVAKNKTHPNMVGGILPSYSKYSTDLDKMEREAYIKIITGEKDINYFDTFVSQWKKQGGDQLTQEANDWYNNSLK